MSQHQGRVYSLIGECIYELNKEKHATRIAILLFSTNVKGPFVYGFWALWGHSVELQGVETEM